MPGDACICCTQSNRVGGDIRCVSLQTANTKEEGARCSTSRSRLLQFRVFLHRCRTHPRTVKLSLLLCIFCFFSFRDANNHLAGFPTSTSIVYTHVLVQCEGQSYTTVPCWATVVSDSVHWCFKTSSVHWRSRQKPCPRTPFQVNSGSDGELYPSIARLRSRSSNVPGFRVKTPPDCLKML